MSWSLFNKKRNLSDELKKRNKSLEDKVFSKKLGIFEKQSLFFKKLFRLINVDGNIKNQIEDLLLGLDFGPFLSDKLSESILMKLPKHAPTNSQLQKSICDTLIDSYGNEQSDLNIKRGRTNVILMVGANGSGKTTSLAKLAHYFKSMNYKVLIVAGDTFRAGASEQLNVWANKLEIDILLPLKHKEDPSSLVYRALSNDKSDYDLIIFDTSGKQHNNQNLLNELNKMIKTMKRFDESFPHEVLLVLDSTIGQSSLLHAEQFLNYSHTTGIILSKMDSMTRGGVIFAIKQRFKIPVKFIGTGEKVDDLLKFNLPEIVMAWTSNF